jgi:hypothetical protein
MFDVQLAARLSAKFSSYPMSPRSNATPSGWKHFFERRNKAAVEGRHLPRTGDLMLGLAFFEDDLRRDAQTWAERLLMRLDEAKQDPACVPVVQALERLTVSPDIADFSVAGKVLTDRELPDEHWLPRDEAHKRCMVYRAALGDKLAIAEFCSKTAEDLRTMCDDHDLSRARMLMLIGASAHLDPTECREEFGGGGMRRFRRAGERVGMRLACLKEPSALAPRFKSEWGSDDDADLEVDEQAGAEGRPSRKTEHDGPGKVVFGSIGNEKISENNKIRDWLKPVLGKRLPLRPVPPMATVRNTLRSEFPHAHSVIDTMLEDLAGRDHVAMRPTVLAGLPGCGKTTFAIRFAELVGLSWEIYPCAAVHDAKFAGTARGWSSGEPAFPTSLIVSSAIANPVVILDEIEKAGGTIWNGSLLEALLPMLEARSAAKFFDVFVEASVDLSGVIFLGTANDPARMPRPLRDRCRILTFPSPERAHLSALVPGLLSGIVAATGMDARWIAPLSPDEFEHLATAWPGGSLRALQRMIEAVLRARDHGREYH